VSNNHNAKTLAWVHHANTGSVSLTDVNKAIEELASPPSNSAFVVFAHMGAGDSGYNPSMAIKANRGIPDHNIFEIQNLMINQFGIENPTEIGY
jgi:hypothetical protein